MHEKMDLLIFAMEYICNICEGRVCSQMEQMRPSPHLYLQEIRVNVIFATYLLNSKHE